MLSPYYCVVLCHRVELDCTRGPCMNGGSCEDVVKSCQHCASFKCLCPSPFTGLLCNDYKRCYNDTRRCYVTDYSRRSFDEAQRHCLHVGNLSLPVLRSLDLDRTFRTYLQDDPRGLLQTQDVWLGARSQPISAGSQLEWTWVDGPSTSKY